MKSGDFTTVFCDDVRQELSGKHILIGVYGSDLVPGILPQTVPLALWVNIKTVPTGPHTFKLGLKSDAGEVGIDGGFDFPDTGTPQAAILAFGPLPVTITKPGVIVASVTFDNGKSIEIGRLTVQPVPSNPTHS